MRKTFEIRAFNDERNQWLFVLDNDVLELFSFWDGTSMRCHLAAIDSFEWEVDRKGRFIHHVIKNHHGRLLLNSLRIWIAPEIEAEARAFSALVMDAIRKYTL